MNNSEKKTQRMTGEVVSKKTAKTVKVKVAQVKVHPIYKKRYVQSKHYLVHDENDVAKPGDRVEIVSIKPQSKLKRFAISKIM